MRLREGLMPEAKGKDRMAAKTGRFRTQLISADVTPISRRARIRMGWSHQWHRVIAVALIGVGVGAGPGSAVACVGDCKDTGTVDIADLIIGVNIALGALPVTDCEVFANQDGKVDIAQLVTGVRNALNGCPLAEIMQVNLASNDLVYDRFTDMIYASVPSRAGAIGNAIASINPHTGAIGKSVFVGSEPGNLAISDDGQFLYVALDGASSIRRFNIATMTPEIEFPLGEAQYFGLRSAGEIKVVPGNAHTIAVSLRYSGTSPAFAGVAIFDDGVKRPKETPDHTGADEMTFSDSPSILYGQDTEDTGADFFVMTLDESGVSITYDSGPYGGPFGEFGAGIQFDGGLIYATSGQVYDPVAMRLVGTFGKSGLVAPDSAAQRVFFLPNDFEANATVSVFDQETFLPVGSFEIPGISGNGFRHSFFRWGRNGLAFGQSPDFSGSGGDKVFLIQTLLASPSSKP